MEVLVGFGAAEAYVRDMGVGEAQDNGQGGTVAPLSRRMIFQKRNSYKEEEEEDDDDDVGDSDRSSSSIGIPDDSDDDDGEEALSKVATEGFGSLGSMEDSLPVKRGLSNHFSGKSKSFTNLAEAAIATTTAKELEKTEHPFNKKRRILRWSKNLMILPTALSMPILPVSEEDESRRSDHDDNDRDRGSDMEKELPTPRSVFKSYSCFALTDLREEDEEDEEEEEEEEEEDD